MTTENRKNENFVGFYHYKLIISAAPDMILISDKKFAQNVKKIIKGHDKEEPEEFLKALKDQVGKHEKELENINKELANAKAKLKYY